MEGTSQQENQELEYKNLDEDQGGIHRRLRDRDLLRKRKAEAEAKETNQEESQRKRRRAETKSGVKRRGRPRKTEPTSEISASQEEVTVPQVAPIELPEPAEVAPDQTSGSLESQPTSVLAASAPLQLFGSFQNPALTSPAPGGPSPAFISPSGPSPSSTKILDTAQIPVQELAPVLALAQGAVSVPAPDQDPVQDLGQAPIEITVPPAATPPDLQSAPAQMEILFTGTQGKEVLNKVIIEDLGPDEEEDIAPSQETRNDEDLRGTSSFSTPEQSKVFSVPTLSSQPPPPEYLPGNSL